MECPRPSREGQEEIGILLVLSILGSLDEAINTVNKGNHDGSSTLSHGEITKGKRLSLPLLLSV